MKIFYLILFLAVISFQIKSIPILQTYKKALTYIFSGDLLATKRIVTEQNLSLDKTIIFHAPLMHHLALNPAEDIENTHSIFKFINEKANITQKDKYNSTILHQAAKSKNIAAIITLAENNQYKKILYDQDARGLTALFHATQRSGRQGRKIFNSYGQTSASQSQEILRSCTMIALKNSGYRLEEDPLYKQNKLPNEIAELWLKDAELNDKIELHKKLYEKQQDLKNTIQAIIRLTGYQYPIQIQINNSDDLACARKYGKLLTIDISPELEQCPYKKPIILHELAYHLFGYTLDHDNSNYENLYLEDFQKQDDRADDFVIKICPQEFIDYCQFCLKNNIPSRVRSFKERIERAKAYLKASQ